MNIIVKIGSMLYATLCCESAPDFCVLLEFGWVDFANIRKTLANPSGLWYNLVHNILNFDSRGKTYV